MKHTEFEKDIMDYAMCYGFDALGYAIYDLIKNFELGANITQEMANNVWEYGGNRP